MEDALEIVMGVALLGCGIMLIGTIAWFGFHLIGRCF